MKGQVISNQEIETTRGTITCEPVYGSRSALVFIDRENGKRTLLGTVFGVVCLKVEDWLWKKITDAANEENKKPSDVVIECVEGAL